MMWPVVLVIASALAQVAPAEDDVIRIALEKQFELREHAEVVTREPPGIVLVGKETKVYEGVRPEDPHFVEDTDTRRRLVEDFVRRNEQAVPIGATLPPSAVFADLEPYQEAETVDWSALRSVWPDARAVIRASRPAFTADASLAMILLEEFHEDGYLGFHCFLRRDAAGRWSFAHIVRMPRPAEILQREADVREGSQTDLVRTPEQPGASFTENRDLPLHLGRLVSGAVRTHRLTTPPRDGTRPGRGRPTPTSPRQWSPIGSPTAAWGSSVRPDNIEGAASVAAVRAEGTVGGR